MRSSQLPIVLALLLAACEPSSSGPSAGPTASATATATTPSASALASAAPAALPAEPSPDTLPENAAIRFEWFAYASLARDGRHNKLSLDRLMTKTPPVLMLSYLPDIGQAPPDKEVSGAQRDALVRVIEAAKMATRKPVHRGKDGLVPKYSYVLSVSWPREGRLPASYSTAWTDLTETGDLTAVRKAMYELGSAKFPAVTRAMPKP